MCAYSTPLMPRKTEPRRMVAAEEEHLPAAAADLRGVHGERHRQAAGDQHGRVDRAERDVELVARVAERPGVERAIDGVGE